MKNESNSRSAFFNLRISISLLIVLLGAFLALIGFGTISNGSAKGNGSPLFGGTTAHDRRSFDQYGNRASSVGFVHRHAVKYRRARILGEGAWSSLGPPGGDVSDAAASSTNPD